VTSLRPLEYVASGTGAVFHPSVAVGVNGAAAAGQAVAWSTSSPRVVLSAATSNAGADGGATVAANGSLRDGESATVQACAWSTVCATQSLVGVAAASLRMQTVAGDAQTMPAAGTLSPVTLRVVDTTGHPVAGAAVTLHQQVTGWHPPCATGRCAAAPVYGKSTLTAMSDDDGMLVVTPLQYATTAAVTKITATAGTQAELTVTLTKTP
jgi:hypothetical protein